MEKYKDKDDQMDIIDQNKEKTGEIKGYTEIHKNGLLHLTVHVWLMNKNGEFLLQKRSKEVAVFPEKWDVSATGHVNSGQSSLEAAQMEMMEELGLYLPLDNFEYLFTVRENTVFDNGEYIHKENALNDIYLVHLDVSIEDLKLAKEEVSETKWIKIADLEKIAKGDDDTVTPHIYEYKKLLEYFNTLK